MFRDARFPRESLATIRHGQEVLTGLLLDDQSEIQILDNAGRRERIERLKPL
jgi:hypothetical protein